MPGRLLKQALGSDSLTGELVGWRVYPADAVPKNADLPLIGYALTGSQTDTSLDGTLCGVLATFTLTILGETYADVNKLRLALPKAMNDAGAVAVAELTMDGAEATDLGDEPQGPIDLDGRKAFIGDATVTFYFRITNDETEG